MKVGIHCWIKRKYLDSRFRGNDTLSHYPLPIFIDSLPNTSYIYTVSTHEITATMIL